MWVDPLLYFYIFLKFVNILFEIRWNIRESSSSHEKEDWMSLTHDKSPPRDFTAHEILQTSHQLPIVAKWRHHQNFYSHPLMDRKKLCRFNTKLSNENIHRIEHQSKKEWTFSISIKDFRIWFYVILCCSNCECGCESEIRSEYGASSTRDIQVSSVLNDNSIFHRL